MSIKKFILSDGYGGLEESELDSDSSRTIGYNDITQKIEISNAHIINNLTISGSIKEVNEITSSQLLVSNNLRVNGTASIGFLETIQQQNLLIGDKYITILSGANDHISLDGAGVLWGSGSSDGTTGDQNSVAYVLYRGIGAAADYLEIFPGLSVSGSLNVSGNISGTFSGDGSGLTGITAGAVDLQNYPTLSDVSGNFATLAGVSSSFTTPQQVQDIVGNIPQEKLARIDVQNYFEVSQFITGALSVSSGITGSFSGDGGSIANVFPKVKFTHAAEQISVGQAVALTSNGLAKCDNNDNEKSNFIGIVTYSGSDGLYVQTSGEAELQNLLFAIPTPTTGSTLWVLNDGRAGTYTQIGVGQYATQIGYMSGNGPNKIIIQPRVFGQL